MKKIFNIFMLAVLAVLCLIGVGCEGKIKVTEKTVIGTYKPYTITITENGETSTLKATDGDSTYNEDFEVYVINADKTYNVYSDGDLYITGTWELQDKKLILTHKISPTSTENYVTTMDINGNFLYHTKTETVNGKVTKRVWKFKKVSSYNIYASKSV